MYEKQKIVILGGGYAGLMTAVTLQKKVHNSRAEITLVNRNDYHYITTKVHENGAGTLHPDAITLPIKELIDEERVHFIQDEVVSIDKISKQVTLKNSTLSYDYLVVGVGGVPKTFNIPGLEEHAFFLADLNGTNQLREHIEHQFVSYLSDQDESRLVFVIGGAGFSGIEFYYELTHRLSELSKKYDVPSNKIKLQCVDAAPNILMGYDDSIVIDVVNHIQAHHLEFEVGVGVASYDGKLIQFTDGKTIHSRTLIWAGGVKGHPLLEGLGFELYKDGRVILNECLEVPGQKDIYVLGDAAVSFSPEGIPYPPTAQIAIQQGQYAGYHLAAKIYGLAFKPFKYIYRGTVMSMGKGNATGIVYGKHIKGFVASFMKWVIEMRYYFMLGGIPLTLKQWKKLRLKAN